MSAGRLQGKSVIVTGAASGIGAATARLFAEHGARVAGFDRNAPADPDARIDYHQVDITDVAAIEAAVAAVRERTGRIDALVNNAGIMVIGKTLDVPIEHQLKQLDINVKGVVNGCHEVAPRLIAHGGGQIVNIASLAGRFAAPGAAVYSGTKAAVLAFTDALDAELAPQGVRVSAVLPSFTNTGLISGTEAPAMTPAIEPTDVAAAVLGVLEKYRPQATVPKYLAFSAAQWSMYPQRMRRWMGTKTGMATMFLEVDHDARADYE